MNVIRLSTKAGKSKALTMGRKWSIKIFTELKYFQNTLLIIIYALGINHLPLHCRIMRKTLFSLESLSHLIKTAVPNWFRRRPFDVINSSVRFGTRLDSKGPLGTAFSVQRSDDYAMLMIPNKDETAVHVCHCRCDIVLRMLKVMAIPRRWYVS